MTFGRQVGSAAIVAVSVLLLLTGSLVPAWAEDFAHDVTSETGITGGLVVHVGCRDGALTAQLGVNQRFLVVGLDRDPQNVADAQGLFLKRHLSGRVSAIRLEGDTLPFIDNLVNMAVVEDPSVPAKEIFRVLCPEGMAYIKTREGWKKEQKPRPAEIDEWTHYLHDATGNAVAHDSVVGPPRRYQWLAGPRWSRHHDHMSSISAMVSTGGKLFCIFDEGSRVSVLLPPRWRLIARDAFNGVVLWKRDIPKWHDHLFPLKSGPANLPRRLVAVGDTVYATLGIDAPVKALDASTGQTLREYENTRNTEEILVADSLLLALVNKTPEAFQRATEDPEKRRSYDGRTTSFPHMLDQWAKVQSEAWFDSERSIVVFDAVTGKPLWRKDDRVMPMSLATDGKRVYYHDGEKVVALSRTGGHVIWVSKPVPTCKELQSWFAPTLVVYDGVVLYAGGENMKVSYVGWRPQSGEDTMTALSAETGETLWTAFHPFGGYNSPEDLLIADGLVWTGATAKGNADGTLKGHDPRTGEIRDQLPPTVKTFWFHHRCHRAKATDRYLLLSRTGIEFLDIQTKQWTPHHWVRGGCLYGVMPANGLLYAPPHPCACYPEAKLTGFSALAPAAKEQLPELSGDSRFQRGPAYGSLPSGNGRGGPVTSSALFPSGRWDDWPTYRGDALRSGFTPRAVSASLGRLWKSELGGGLTSMTSAGGRLYVAARDVHTLYALDEAAGEVRWRYLAGGRVDSPPTIYRDRVLFGCADGYVYCLRATDGALLWRFRAAPADRRMVVDNRVESVWPLHGSVLVQGGALYCVAGRSMFLDGGLRLLKLDPLTGRRLAEAVLDDRDPETGENLQVRLKSLSMPVASADILSSDGKHVYMRSQVFDLSGNRPEIGPLPATLQQGETAHLFSPYGFTDDSWMHRTYWVYGRAYSGGAGGYAQAGKNAPAGRILVFDDEHVFGYGRLPEYYRWTTPLEFHLYCAEKQPGNPPQTDPKDTKEKRRKGTTAIVKTWEMPSLVLARSMVLAGQTLFVAGPKALLNEREILADLDDPTAQRQLANQDAALAGKHGALLVALSAKDGSVLQTHELETPPVFDGLIASRGRLYFAGLDGSVQCYGAQSAEEQSSTP